MIHYSWFVVHYTIRLRGSPSNITIIQAYAPISNYSDDDVEYFYGELQKVLDKTPPKRHPCGARGLEC